ncbi:MAG: TIGR04282 family arsenosugar biosynthesis glycosyltransferase [Nitrospinales bacterium]
MGSTEKKALVLFARDPVLGRVKTRLQSMFDEATVLDLYTCFLQDSIDKICALKGVELFIGAYPDASSKYFDNISEQNKITIFPQEGEDLGQRMKNAFLKLQQDGFQKVVIIGSDSPNLPLSYIEAAFDSDKEVVIGPSTDGGYYLIGMNRRVTDVFSEISWGTADVLPQTTDRLIEKGAELKLLPLWYDIDHPEDLKFLKTHLELMEHVGEMVPAATKNILNRMDLG